MLSEKQKIYYLCKLSESVERFQDMVEHVKSFNKLNPSEQYSTEDRNLLSIAYKNLIGPKRIALRLLAGIAQKEKAENVEIIKQYSKGIEEEIHNIVEDLLQFTKLQIEKCGEDSIDSVFYHKMQADYYRYLAEFETGAALEQVSVSSKSCYEKACSIAETLPPTDPTKLVYHYEIEKNIDLACQLADKAFDEGVKGIENNSEGGDPKDSTLILQLIRDNLTLWRSEQPTGKEELTEEGKDAQ